MDLNPIFFSLIRNTGSPKLTAYSVDIKESNMKVKDDHVRHTLTMVCRMFKFQMKYRSLDKMVIIHFHRGHKCIE